MVHSTHDKHAVSLAMVRDNVRNITSLEALQSLETMQTFISLQSNVPHFIFTNVQSLQNYLLSNTRTNLVEKKS